MSRDNLDYLSLAIKALNPDAEFQASDIDNIQWRQADEVNGITATTPISKSDIETKIEDIKNNGTVEDQKKTSAKTKLKALGLDDEEIKVLIG
tara:strand:+ start:588 stop:866 length:279 start_codon:yes stop_codon:yes gene_type:complete